MAVKMRIDYKEINKTFDLAKKAEKEAVKDTYDFFVKQTPLKTGNARRSTELKGNIIEADYEYAAVLDKGRHMSNRGARGSYQAPQGMTAPTIRFFRSIINNLIRKIP
jgi:hypothetical protein